MLANARARSASITGTIDGLQVLRAVAALMVVTHHATHSVPGAHWLPFGGAGVDIFFVISGFVMAFTTQNAPAGVDSAVKFALKRIARIVPLFWLAVLWAARRDLGDPGVIQEMLFLPREGTALVQGWTLDFEMAFYALFALCLIFPSRLILLVVGLVLMPLLGALLPGYYGEFYGNAITFEFGFGVLLFEALRRWGAPQWPRAVWLAVLAAGLTALGMLFPLEPRPLTQGLPAVVVVYASIRACEGWLQSRTLRLLGDASYAIYLFHWSSFGAVKPLARMIGPEWIGTLMLAHIAVALVSGCLIHLLLERRLTSAAQVILGLRARRAPSNFDLPVSSER